MNLLPVYLCGPKDKTGVCVGVMHVQSTAVTQSGLYDLSWAAVVRTRDANQKFHRGMADTLANNLTFEQTPERFTIRCPSAHLFDPTRQLLIDELYKAMQDHLFTPDARLALYQAAADFLRG